MLILFRLMMLLSSGVCVNKLLDNNDHAALLWLYGMILALAFEYTIRISKLEKINNKPQ